MNTIPEITDREIELEMAGYAEHLRRTRGCIPEIVTLMGGLTEEHLQTLLVVAEALAARQAIG